MCQVTLHPPLPSRTARHVTRGRRDLHQGGKPPNPQCVLTEVRVSRQGHGNSCSKSPRKTFLRDTEGIQGPAEPSGEGSQSVTRKTCRSGSTPKHRGRTFAIAAAPSTPRTDLVRSEGASRSRGTAAGDSVSLSRSAAGQQECSTTWWPRNVHIFQFDENNEPQTQEAPRTPHAGT